VTTSTSQIRSARSSSISSSCPTRSITTGTFERDEELSDEALLALALRAAELLGMEEEEISEFFEREFNLAGMTGGPIGTALAFGMLIDAARRLQARGGGRN